MLDTLYYIVIYPIQLIIEILFNTVYYWQIGIGLTIFIVSLFVNLSSLPMFLSAYKLQKKERDIQEKMAPKVKSIKENFKGAEKFMILSTYYRQNNYHPIMSLRISLSLLLEIPFFTAAYLFFSHLDMLTGMNWWIVKDLSLPDGLLKINNLSVNVLPILMTIFNIISCEIYMNGFKFKEKVQIYSLAFVFLIILYNSPSGLVLYWTFNNLISLIRNFIMKLKNSKKIFFITLIIMSFLLLLKIPFYKLPFILVNLPILLFIFAIPVYVFINYIKDDFLLYRTKIYVLSSICLVLLLSLVIPSSLIASSPLEFFSETASPLNLLYYPIAQGVGLLFFWPTIFYFFMSDKIKNFILLIFLTLLFCSIFSIVTLPNIGQISPVFVLLTLIPHNFDGFFTNKFIIINLLGFFIIPIILVFLIYKKKFNFILNVISILIFAILFLSFINLYKIPKIYKEYKESFLGNNTLNTEIHLSKNNKNVIVFLLDRSVNHFLPIIFNEKPELKEIYTGFTYFPNTVSYYPYTILALPSVLGGYEYIPQFLNKRTETLKEKITEGLLMLPLLFKQNSWQTTIFDIPFEVNSNSILSKYGITNNKLLGKYNNIYKNQFLYDIDTEFSLQKRNFLLYSIMIITPAIFKDIVYDNGDYLNINKNLKVLNQELLSSYSTLYFLPKITDFDSTKNTFTFIYNLLPHTVGYLEYPKYSLTGKTVLNTNITFDEQNSEKYHLNMASFLLISEFLKCLKENNVYDNTKIIIVSDHGSIGTKNSMISKNLNSNLIPFNPILFVKDFNARGEYKTDYTFMTNADVPVIATTNAIENPINPFTHNKIKNDEKNNGAILFVEHKKWNIEHFNSSKLFDKDSLFNYVKDNVFDEGNWILNYKYHEEKE